MLVRLSRDPWVPWTTSSPFEPIAPERRAVTNETAIERQPQPGAPAVSALLWVRAADGTMRRVLLPLGL